MEDKNNSNKIIHLKISSRQKEEKYFSMYRWLQFQKIIIGVINILIRSFTFEIMRQTNTFANSGKASLYNTVNQ